MPVLLQDLLVCSSGDLGNVGSREISVYDVRNSPHDKAMLFEEPDLTNSGLAWLSSSQAAVHLLYK